MQPRPAKARTAPIEETPPVLEVETLGVTFPGRPPLRAVDQVNLTINRGESFGLIGESGSGKSTTARVIAGLQSPTEGSLRFQGRPLATPRSRADYRAIQMVFQDSAGSLNPRLTVFETVVEPLIVHEAGLDRKQKRDRVFETLADVGLSADLADRLPGQLSGGQRQRVNIARALMLEPTLLVLDEPVSALDVSVQARILNLLRDLRAGRDLTLLFIGHDLAVVEFVCDRIAVMQAGKIVELGPAREMIQQPAHPYSRQLRDAVLTLP
jgi:peptide/nickel transport system ATP-binding protein